MYLPAGNLSSNPYPCLQTPNRAFKVHVDFVSSAHSELSSQLLIMPHNRHRTAPRSTQGQKPFSSLALGAHENGTKTQWTNNGRLAKVGWVESAASLKPPSFDPLRGMAPSSPVLRPGVPNLAGRNPLEQFARFFFYFLLVLCVNRFISIPLIDRPPSFPVSVQLSYQYHHHNRLAGKRRSTVASAT